jgi:phage shock protein C
MSNYEPYTQHVAPSVAPSVAAQPTGRSLLARSRNDRMLTGVCGGFAEYTGFDANLIRILLVAATVLGFGSPIIVYVAAWLLLPEAA